MAYTIVQSDDDLFFVNTDGDIQQLTIPSAYTLLADRPPRWQVYGQFAVLVNTPNRPLTIDATGTVRPLAPAAPSVAPIVAVGSSGTLSGNYSGIRYTFIIKDSNGRLIAESDMSPASNSVTLTNDQLLVTGIGVSNEPITARRLYRPTTDGTTLFPWLDLDGNTLTQVQDDLSDAGLSILAAPTLGNPPRLVLIKEWRNRLWGVGDLTPDTLQFSQANAMWSWPLTNSIEIPGTGRDIFGIRALMPRREALGVGRRDLIWQITGQTSDDFRAVKLSEILGVESQESVVVYRDVVWWLWKDGVYQWDSEGIRNISDGKVKSWFSGNSDFNRDMFEHSFAVFDPLRLKYRLYLASAGSTSIDRWVEYDIVSKTWWGPHKTSAFTPSCAFILSDAADKMEAIAGATDGFIWQEHEFAYDGTHEGIEFLLRTKFFDGKTPEVEKYWGELDILGKAQDAGIITVTPRVGYLNAEDGPIMEYDMTQGRQSLDRLGSGKMFQIDLEHSEENEPVELYGIETFSNIIGRR